MSEIRTPQEVLLAATPLTGRRVVDVGCGEGTLTRFLASQGASEVVGVECGDDMLAHAHAGEAMDNLRFLEGVGEDLPLPDASVDLVVFSNSLHHVPPAAQFAALEEAHRVLRPDGELLVLEPIARGATQTLMAPVHDETEVRAHAQTQLAAIVESGRFTLTEAFEFTKVVHHASFEAFRDRILRINPHRKPEVAAIGERWRDIFEEAGQETDAGWRFDQPIAFAHLRKA